MRRRRDWPQRPSGAAFRGGIRFLRSACAASLISGALADSVAGQRVRIEPRGSAVGIAIEVLWPSTRFPGSESAKPADSALARGVASAASEFAGWSAVTAFAVECEAHALRISFAVTTERWQAALRALARTLGEASAPAAGPMDRPTPLPAREESPGLANPSLEFDALLRRARRPAAIAAPPCDLLSGGGRPASGGADTPAAAPSDRVRARVAVYGPVDSAGASALLDSLFDAPRRPLGAAAATSSPRRLTLERATVSAWIGIAHPLRDEVPAESLHLLAFRLEEQLRATIGREALFDVRALVVPGEGLDWLELRMLVDAGAAPSVERRARETLASASVWALAPADFAGLRDRFRGDRLRGLAAPEQRAREALLSRAFAEGELSAAIDRLRSADLEVAARALGPPAVARVGPREALDPSRRSP